MKIKASITVGGDEGFELCVEALVHVGRVRAEGDGHGAALTGHHHLFCSTSTQPAR